MLKSPAFLFPLLPCAALLGCAATPPAKSADPPVEAVEATESGAADEPRAVVSKRELSPEEIREVIRGSFDQFRACYQEGLARNPKLAGRVTLRLVIEASGQVAQAELLREAAHDALPTDLPDAQVLDCMLDVARQQRFPAFANGEVTVVYPIVFAPEEPHEGAN